MIVPFPAGGATDTLARFLSEQMRTILGQPIIIENIAGAAGSIGRSNPCHKDRDCFVALLLAMTVGALPKPYPASANSVQS